ncbi:hypothetical protein HK097_011079 [Rhizophlyctis rosea]|uniref:Uncharacterized protein n=1 Tax=Rhizophlyctis rosea TaxID=64517 RepID=A0AAD5S6T9_9FUNG|nr:hypothetical protein HK097_011079 [Rhizophlyctis rosea]
MASKHTDGPHPDPSDIFTSRHCNPFIHKSDPGFVSSSKTAPPKTPPKALSQILAETKEAHHKAIIAELDSLVKDLPKTSWMYELPRSSKPPILGLSFPHYNAENLR